MQRNLSAFGKNYGIWQWFKFVPRALAPASPEKWWQCNFSSPASDLSDISGMRLRKSSEQIRWMLKLENHGIGTNRLQWGKKGKKASVGAGVWHTIWITSWDSCIPLWSAWFGLLFLCFGSISANALGGSSLWLKYFWPSHQHRSPGLSLDFWL